MNDATARPAPRGRSVSLVIPVFNEADNVEPLCSEIDAAFANLDVDFAEVIFVDDGSTDATFEHLKRIATGNRRYRIIRLRRQLGQTQALAAGIAVAAGTVIVTMDGDRQNDPADIPALLGKLDEGYDLVAGWRHLRQDRLLSRRIPSMLANFLLRKITGVAIKDSGCSLKAFRAALLKRLPLYSDMHRFIPAIASMAGPRIAQIPVNHRARVAGRSKYGLSRTYKVILDILTIKLMVSFSTRPLKWFSICAAPFVLLSLGLTALTVVIAWQNDGYQELPLAGTALLYFHLAFFLFMCGALGELVYRAGDTDVTRFPLLTSRDASSTRSSGHDG